MKNHVKQTIKIFLEEISRFKLLTAAMFFCMTMAYTGRVIIPLFFKKMFDAIYLDNYNMAIQALIVVLLIEAADWIFWRAGFFTLNYCEANIYAGLNKRVFAYLHKHSFEFFSNNFSGSLTKKFLSFSKSFLTIFDAFIFNIWSTLLSIIFILTVLFFKNIYLGGGILLWLVIVIFINFKFSKYKFKHDRLRNEADSAVGADIADTTVNYGNIKLFNGYGKERGRFFDLNLTAKKLKIKADNYETMADGVQGFFGVFLEVGIFYFALRLWQQGQFTVGDFVLLQSYIIFIFNHIWNFSNVLRRLFVSFSEADEMSEILSTPHEVSDVKNAKALKVGGGDILFKDVGFNYRKTRKIFNKFNLSIPAKQRVALIGPSGAGKSTAIKLLLRNYDLLSGKILIDKQDISRVTQESLWQNVSLVPQDPILFHRSLKENIAYGKEGATDDEIIKASKLARCHNFITGLVDGYDTLVGERGVKLSGGERQRVAIARAILKNAPILILDEATSSLDSESEKLIQAALADLMKDKTVIVIAHRLSTIKKMDRIVVIDNGEVVEDGDHTNLVKLSKGLYRRLWELQAGGFSK